MTGGRLYKDWPKTALALSPGFEGTLGWHWLEIYEG